jgi:hypothetical protein
MAGERLLVPMEDAYATSLGRALYVFATLEWNVVWCCERMQPTYIRNRGRKTAGQIAASFLAFARVYPNYGARDQFEKAGDQFKRIVDKRNTLVHANPATAPGGAQRLLHKGHQWTTDAVDAVADEFALCSRTFNAFLYGELKRKEKQDSMIESA